MKEKEVQEKVNEKEGKKEIELQGSLQSMDSQEDTIVKSCWNADLIIHGDLFKLKTSERTDQRSHDKCPLYRSYIKCHLDLFKKCRHFHTQIQVMLLALTLFHSILPSLHFGIFHSSCLCVLSICGWEICRIICQKAHLETV